MSPTSLSETPLGKATGYSSHYDPELLCSLPRQVLWQERGYKTSPFHGVDVWNAYEISWLDQKGLPQVAVAEFRFPCDSPNIVESKSFKLYLNSFARTRLESCDKARLIMQADLSACAGAQVDLTLSAVERTGGNIQFEGSCLDKLDVSTNIYHPQSDLLQVGGDTAVREKLYSHLLRTLCPVTGQPDWGTVLINYHGPKIAHNSLLQYIVSYREHQDFHEQCVENIYLDVLQRCRPLELTVYARYLRRGGLDINPYRTNTPMQAENLRLWRE